MLNNFLEKYSSEINGIIHVGAHTGQEVSAYSKYKNKIILFEPQRNIYKELLKNTKKVEHIECYNFALGSKNEKRKLYKSEGNKGLSSSVLTPELHLKVQPNISFKNFEEIEVKRFDSLNIETLNFLTLDVQGFELEVLKGFGEKLSDIEFIFTEINTKFLYKNNALVSDLDEYLKDYDFVRVFTNIDCFNYFGDALYIKKTNNDFEKKYLKKIINIINISNYYLNLKKLQRPRKLIKKVLRKF